MHSSREMGLQVKKARRYRAQRSRERFSEKDLAFKIGETSKWVKRLERGEFYPDWHALNFIADVCGVELEELTGQQFSDEIEYQDAIGGGKGTGAATRELNI